MDLEEMDCVVPVIDETLGATNSHSQSSLEDTDEITAIRKEHPAATAAPIKWALKKWMTKVKGGTSTSTSISSGRKPESLNKGSIQRYFITHQKQLSLISSSSAVLAVLSFYFLFFRSS